MLLEVLLVLLLIATILVFFYKQAVQEFRIVQTDSLQKVPSLLAERCPIVIYPFPNPQNLWTYEDVLQRRRLRDLPITGKVTVHHLTYNEEPPALSSEFSERIATEAGLDVWVNHEVLPVFKGQPLLSPFLRAKTSICIGPQGLRQTFAYATVLVATEGCLRVSLLTESADPFLPADWRGRRLSKLTRDDTPLIGQIQTVEVVVHKGSALIIPPHWRICWDDDRSETEKGRPSLSVLVELHHPVSRLIQHIAEKRVASKI